MISTINDHYVVFLRFGALRIRIEDMYINEMSDGYYVYLN